MSQERDSESQRWPWPKPELTRAGQQAFWDRQAPIYDLADMTQDNAEELTCVEVLCQDFVMSGYVAEDVVSLGGAVGCRDPLVVLNELERLGQVPKRVYFNDLSEQMVIAALEGALTEVRGKGMSVIAHHGPIHEVVELIPNIPRRVILGVYSNKALIRPWPGSDYPHPGLKEYALNSKILGDNFIIEQYLLEKGIYVSRGQNLQLLTEEKEELLDEVLEKLHVWEEDAIAGAIQIVGQHQAYPNDFFLSHWFNQKGIIDLVSDCFHKDRIKTLVLKFCPKGFVLCIDPVEKPRGILTVLNNVIGNILPEEQPLTLRAIDRITV